ncbi:MAG: secretin N-terminal domain-containing protein [Phycisphaerales bacterium]
MTASFSLTTSRTRAALVVAALAAAAGRPISLHAQAPAEQPVVAPMPAAAAPEQPAVPPPAQPQGIRFNFKDAPFDQVLEYFSREAGLPPIWEAPIPQGTLTFISGERYSFEDALTILNLNLAPRGVQLRREKNFLYLSTLKDAVRKASEVVRSIPDGTRPEQIINLTIPLSNARAELVVEQVKPLIAEYGAITAVPAQNMVILVETAAQCRRIQSIIQSIDQVRPVDSAYRLFPLKFAKADAVNNALKGLIGERTKQVFIDKDGRQTVAQDVTVAGLNLQPDPRTNSIIAVGSEARIKVVEELIALLDVPDGGLGEQKMMTFALETITPQQAVAQLAPLFASVEASRRPTIVPLNDASKLTIVAQASLMLQAVALLGEIDPAIKQGSGAEAAPVPERRATVIRLTHITPQAIEQIAPRLLSARQFAAVKFAATPDQHGLVATGTDADLAAFEKLVAGLDVPPEISKEIRQVRIASGDIQAVLTKAQALHVAAGRDKAAPVVASADAASRTVTLIGSRAAIEQFADLLRAAESTAVVDLETRSYTLRRANASMLAQRLARLLRPMLTPDDGSAYVEPQIEPVDELRTLIVRSRPEQASVIERLIAQLDTDQPGSRQFRVVRLGGSDPAGLIARVQGLYKAQTEGVAEDQAGPVDIELDKTTGSAIITASPSAMRLFTDLLTQAQQLVPPARSTRVVEVQRASATDLLKPLNEFLASADSIDPGRAVPPPTIRVVESTNALLVTAEDAQHRLIQDFVARLDRAEGPLPPMRLLQLRAAEANAVAQMLNDQYSRRPQPERAAKPVEVRADAATNTLIVSAHPDLFEEIKGLVTELNAKERLEGTGKVTRLFSLKLAKAVDVAAALDKLYPVPPVPVDRQNRPMPWLQQPKPVTVSADQASNTLMIYAAQDQMESIEALAEKLDRVELPPQSELRTYHVTGSNLEAISRTLNGMASRGILAAPAQPGKPAVQVMIETEPKSSTLIVAGDALTFERVDKMLKELAAVPIEKGLRIFPVANVRAEEVRERALAIYTAQVAQIPDANPVEVTVDSTSNSLMVVADAEAMQRFARVIDELSRQQGQAREVRLVELRNAKAAAVQSFLQDLIRSSESFRIKGGADPVIEAIEDNNSLLVAAQPSQFPIIEALARNMDSRSTAERPPLRILRLRTTDAPAIAAMLQSSFDRRPVEERATKPVSIEADAATNTLMVSAHPDTLTEVEAVVSELNSQQAFDAEGREIRIFPLQVARAEELARTIDAMYPEPPMPLDPRTRQPRPDLQRPREVVVRADRATNSLIVDAPAKRLAGFEQIVRSLDQQKLAGNVELRTYRVERADLNAAAAALRAAAASGALQAGAPEAALVPISVDVEPASRTLIVSGPSAAMANVEAVLKKLDAAPDRPATGVKMYALKSARAEKLQAVVRKVVQGRVREQREAAGKSGNDAEALVDVSADVGSNTLVVSAPEDALLIADALINSLDQQANATATELRVFRLTKADAASVAATISKALAAEAAAGGGGADQSPSVSAEPSSNSVVVLGTSKQIERAAALVKELDARGAADGVGVRTIRLKHARSESLAPVLETLLKKQSVLSLLPSWQVGQYIAQSGGKIDDEARVAADRNTNSIIITAPAATLDMAEQIIGELDADPGQRADRPLRVITLQNADAVALAQSIEALIAAEAGGAGAEPPTVRVDPASNSLILRASPEQMRTIEGLVEKLDAATLSSSRQMRLVPIDRSRADAALVAQTLKRILEDQGSKVEVISADELMNGRPAPKGETPPAPRSDSGSPGAMPTFVCEALLATVLAVADTPDADADDEQPEPPDQPPAPAGPGSSKALAEPALTIAVDAATNSLVVVGSPRATDRLSRLAAELISQMPAEPTRVRVVSLPAALDADALVQVIRQTVQQLGRTGPANPGGFTGSVAVAPDPAGGAIIVWANDTDFEPIAEVIRALAQTDTGLSTTVKVYRLSTIPADRAVNAVRDLISPRPRGQQAQRLRGAQEFTLQSPDGHETRGKVDPASIRLTADPGGSAVIVAAPAAALPIIDRFIALIDQSPSTERLAIRRYQLRHAQASELSSTLQSLFDAQRQGPDVDDLPRARFVAEARTNALLITGSDAQHAEVARLLESLDATAQDSGLRLEIITLASASPQAVRQMVEQVVVGKDQGLKNRVQVSAQDSSNLIVVKAPAEQMEQIKSLVAQIDKADASAAPIRYIKLEHADAQVVAQALQRFFQDRQQVVSRGGQREGTASGKVAIAGDRRSGTLIVSASDEDFAQLESLAQNFDKPAKGKSMQYRIIPLQNARVTDIENTVQSIASELQWERMGGYSIFYSPWDRNGGGDDKGGEDKLFVEVNERINSVVLLGQGETIETMIKIIAELDKPQDQKTKMIVRAVQVNRGDLRAMANLIESAMQSPDWDWWRGQDPEAVTVQVDATRRLLLLIGKQPRVEQAMEYVNELATAGGRGPTTLTTLSLKHAQAPRAAESLRRVFADRAAAEGLPPDSVSIIPSTDGNLLMVSADDKSMAIVRDLIALIDQPELGKDRQVEVYVLKNREPEEIANLVRAQFPRTQSRPESQVIVTPQPSAGRLIVSAQADDQPQLRALIQTLDTPPSQEGESVVTANLKSARAEEVASALRGALPQGLKVRITPIRRNNTLLISGSNETVQLVLDQIAKIDVELERPLVELKRVVLKNADAYDAWYTLSAMLRGRPRSAGEPDPAVDYTRDDNSITFSGTPDQLKDIDRMIAALDVPTQSPRRTEFVKLQFAKAEQAANALKNFYGSGASAAASPTARNATVIADPASNSLVISAANAEWEGIRSLLKKLDIEEYDTTRQMAVIPLKHADAQSIARALNEGFRAPVEDQIRRTQAERQTRRGNRQNEDEPIVPTILVDKEDRPTVSAEEQTNSLVVFAGRQDMLRIRSLVESIDVPDFNKYPEAHVLPLATGKASQIAQAVRELFIGPAGGGGGGAGRRAVGPRSVVIVGDDASNSLIIRAEERDFAQIKALAATLEQQGDRARATVRVLLVKNVPAARLQKALATTFAPAARQANEVLSIEVDRSSNSLVVASSGRLFEEIERVVKELDGGVAPPNPGAQVPGAPAIGAGLGQAVLIIDVQNNSPDEVRRQLEQLGVTRPATDDRPGVVSEPVSIVPLTTRRAIAVVASPKDGESIVALVRALDAAPISPEQRVAVVALKLAGAQALVNTLDDMLSPAAQPGQTGPAAALAEQVRRLSMSRAGIGQGDLSLDLAVPLRLIADAQTNSIIIASSQSNVAALTEVIRTLDALPIGDAVVVRMFPLSNASAVRAKAVVDDLFRQGDALRKLPGTGRSGLPTTATGKALAGEVAVSVDERTNTLVVAGREEAVALVEVLIKDLDSDQVSKWIEPTLISLRHADAPTLADTLINVLVRGQTVSPEALGLQKQVGRLRMLKSGRALDDPSARIEADLFAPLSGLVIIAEPQLNALIVVGSRANAEVVRELVAMLDVEAASVANTVRTFPLTHAAADRVASIVADIFSQRQRDPAARAEDRLIVSADLRTNALIASTSPKSFSILETLLKTLDSERANSTVGLHVVAVTGADAVALAPRIARLMQERIQAAQRSGEIKSPTDTFSIEADAANNMLIVACSDENLRLVSELVATLSSGNAALAESTRTDLIQLKAGRAADASATVRQLYADKENERRGDGAVNVLPNDRLNALVVTGTDDDIAQIRRLVERLESADVVTAQDIRRISLNSANAIEVVTLLQGVLAGRPVGGSADSASRQATRLRFFREQVAGSIEQKTGAEPTEAQIDGAIREQVSLNSDSRTNSVVVKAPPEIMAIVQDIISDLDTTSAGARRIESFRLVNADVRQMADLLRDIFTLRQQGNRYVLVPSPASTEPGAESASTLTPVPDERQELSIAIDARTNTLIVSGTDEYLTRVRQVVADLDSIEATERTQQVYAIRNAKARDVATTLQSYFKGESDLQRQLLGPDQSGSIMRQLEQEVTVVGDEKSNKLVISTSPRYMDMVLKMVKELDAAPPQVVIQVLLAEVTVDSSETWGADLTINNFGGDNYNFAGLAAGAGVAAALGVPNLTFASSDFELILRALEAQGRLQVLSGPYLQARNNEPASINVGDNIAIVQGTERTPQGSIRADVKREDVGIKLNVTPSISPDGFVRMEISPEISTVSQKTTQISEDFLAPIINKRNLQTTVTVKDGQTVVLGGLRQTTQDQRRTKVPLLGDIPGIGSLFRSTQTTEVKTELLVILTPRVIYSDSPEADERQRKFLDYKIESLETPESVREEMERVGRFERPIPASGKGPQP